MLMYVHATQADLVRPVLELMEHILPFVLACYCRTRSCTNVSRSVGLIPAYKNLLLSSPLHCSVCDHHGSEPVEDLMPCPPECVEDGVVKGTGERPLSVG